MVNHFTLPLCVWPYKRQSNVRAPNATIHRYDDNQRAPSSWAVSIFVPIMLACLFGFIASYPKVTLWVSNAAQAELAGAVPLVSETTLIAADMKR
jgi:hypothetical protein